MDATTIGQHSKLTQLEEENAALRKQISELEALAAGATGTAAQAADTTDTVTPNNGGTNEMVVEKSKGKEQRLFGTAKLTKNEIERYSRQMLLPDVGAKGTRVLLDSTVLVVGAGGLGSTVIPYLAAAGVGKIIIVDFDAVDESNLHRQIIHNESRVGMQKAISAKLSAEALNSKIIVEAICEPFSLDNAQMLCRRADVVIDASDNVACRYLVNDAAVMEGKPLVSGCATRWEGQLTVYNCISTASPPQTPQQIKQNITPPAPYTFKGPCYRCLFPTPTPTASVGSCNEVGVVGPVPGMIGCLQALEAIKVLLLMAAIAENKEKQKKKKKDNQEDKLSDTAFGSAADSKESNSSLKLNLDLLVGRMLLFDGLRSSYKTVRIRGKQPNCAICCEDNDDQCYDGVTSSAMTSSANNTDNKKMRGFSSLQEAYHQKGLFPEYVTGVKCELPDSERRVDAPLLLTVPQSSSCDASADHCGTINPLSLKKETLTTRYGIVCREADVTEVQHYLSEVANTATSSSVSAVRAIVVDVRPGPQQAIFTLGDGVVAGIDTNNPTASFSSSSPSAHPLPIHLITIDTDTMDKQLPKHVDDIMRAVTMVGEKRQRGSVDDSMSTTDTDGHNKSSKLNETSSPPIPIHFICRRGNKSRKAIYAMAPLIAERLSSSSLMGAQSAVSEASPASSSTHTTTPTTANIELVNVIGGLTYWARDVDKAFPTI